ncbi:hypothetical protein OG242_00430 [Streptomyces sp. NBC_00727]|uniref:hypothetical protein n=1 Tax=Streptomyces sp. NBC_00727 TaxID=2903675 RepID=UPI003867DAE2
MNTNDPMRSAEDEDVCRVCGYTDGDLFFKDTWPTHIICPCCSWESGTQALGLEGTREYRGYWTGQGAPWFSPRARPEEWDLLAQLQNIPPHWR